MIPLGILASAAHRGGIALPQTLLSTVNHASSIVLSNGNRSAEATLTSGTSGIALSASGKSSGRYYAEVECDQWYSASGALAFGIQRGVSGLTSYLGQATGAFASWADGGATLQRSTYNSAVRSNIINTATGPLGQRMRLAVDVTLGKVWMTHFGVEAFLGGGNPAAGENPVYLFDPLGDTFYLALNPRGGSPTVPTSRSRLTLVLPAAWAYPPPAGFGVWTG